MNKGTSCPPTDMACMCADEHYQNSVTSCIMSSCTMREALGKLYDIHLTAINSMHANVS